MTSKLFSSFSMDHFQLSHRVVLAPLTRMRTEGGDIPGDLVVEYYRQRATPGGLLIGEATAVDRLGIAYAGAPGLYSDAQIEGWRKVTQAVHDRGGRIFAQLWHAGRQAHPANTGGAQPVAPSALRSFEYAAVRNEDGSFADAELVMPRALEHDEIQAIVGQFEAAARRALAAGFDGVELHAANGYIIDQFLLDGSNHRSDEYGGSIENRARFLFEVLDAVVGVWGSGRVGMRLSPSGSYGNMEDTDPHATFGYVARRLNDYALAYLHVVEPRIRGNDDVAPDQAAVTTRDMRALYKGTIITAGGFTRETAEQSLRDGDADLIAFGRLFISNPDLPARLFHGHPLQPYDRSTFYGGGARGYTDYAGYDEQQAA